MKSFVWQKLSATALLLTLVFALLGAPAAFASAATAPHPTNGAKALDWTISQQQADGGFPGFGVGSSADAIDALAAGSRLNDAAAINKAIGFLQNNAAAYAKSAGAAAKLVLALTAVGQGAQASSFGGVDLVGMINSQYDASSGHYGGDVTGQALSLLALQSLGQPLPAAAGKWLLGAQAPGGGWAYDGAATDATADTNTTGLVLQALAVSGADWAAAKSKAVAYLKGQQNADAGFAYQKGAGADSDANSTAMVIMGLIAAGEDPESAAWTTGGANPVSFLLSLQNADGAFRYQAAQPDDNAGATYQAIPAIYSKVYPIIQTAPSTAPGMPRTGAADAWNIIEALALAGAMLALLGFIARRQGNRVV